MGEYGIFPKLKGNHISADGTDCFGDNRINFNFIPVEIDGLEGKYHRGFAREAIFRYGNLMNSIATSGAKSFTLSGHSAGGPVIAMIALFLQKSGYKIDSIRLCGCPKFMNKKAQAYFMEKLGDVTENIEVKHDFVTWVPFGLRAPDKKQIPCKSNSRPWWFMKNHVYGYWDDNGKNRHK